MCDVWYLPNSFQANLTGKGRKEKAGFQQFLIFGFSLGFSWNLKYYTGMERVGPGPD
jgi:hypothetical protein